MGLQKSVLSLRWCSYGINPRFHLEQDGVSGCGKGAVQFMSTCCNNMFKRSSSGTKLVCIFR